MTRHELREQVFKLLFRVEFNVPEDMDEQVKLFMEDIDNHASEKENEEINNKYVAVKEHLSEIDYMINDKAENWSVERMVDDKESFRKIVDQFLKKGDIILNRNIPSSYYPEYFLL